MDAKGHQKWRVDTSFTSQSAMEYLMTYGWAILIIAVILGVLFSLGVFNPTNYAPKVPAGNCHVFRPNGPGTNFNVALVGTCSGFLPQYVAQFNGQNSYVNLGNSSDLNILSQITVSVWFKTKALQNEVVIGKSYLVSYYLNANGDSSCLYIGGSELCTTSDAINSNMFHNVVGTQLANGTERIYVDGVLMAQKSGSFPSPDSNSLEIGVSPVVPAYFNGSIANVQLYNASLDSNEIQYLYNEGIGGAPVYLSHLVGWWPLNGDAKDYSGNGNDGTSTNISFNGSWTTGYSQP